jgi:hypothetical protein
LDSAAPGPSVESDEALNDIARIHGDDREERQLSGEEATLLEQPEMVDEAVDELPPNNLFSAEEEAFMHRAVGFLTGRENGDVILGRIWEQLTKSHPENYFDPHDELPESEADTMSQQRYKQHSPGIADENSQELD